MLRERQNCGGLGYVLLAQEVQAFHLMEKGDGVWSGKRRRRIIVDMNEMPSRWNEVGKLSRAFGRTILVMRRVADVHGDWLGRGNNKSEWP
jgi:hypothetical protein